MNIRLESGITRAVVELHRKQAAAPRIGSTPSFLINAPPVSGAQAIDVFRRLIAEVRNEE